MPPATPEVVISVPSSTVQSSILFSLEPKAPPTIPPVYLTLEALIFALTVH